MEKVIVFAAIRNVTFFSQFKIEDFCCYTEFTVKENEALTFLLSGFLLSYKKFTIERR